MQETAKKVIKKQCELLQDSRDQVHKEIIAEVVAEVDRLNGRLASDYDFQTFSHDPGNLMERAVDALNLNEESSASSSSGQKSRSQQQRKPVGLDQ